MLFASPDFGDTVRGTNNTGMSADLQTGMAGDMKKMFSGARPGEAWALLAATILAGALGVSLIRGHGLPRPAPSPAPAAGRDAADAWREAVRSGAAARSLRLAARLAPPDPGALPDDDYLAWMASFGLDRQVLMGPFRQVDFQRWADALLAEEILVRAGTTADASPPPSPASVLKVILSLVSFSSEAPEPGPSANAAVWQAGLGNRRDLIRLLALAMTTAGHHVQAVAIHAGDGAILHWWCEIRDDAGAWVADPAVGFCRRGIDAATLLDNPPDGDDPLPPEVRAQARFISFHLPAEVSDYRPCQQRLARYLADLPDWRGPRLADDPRQRIEAWRAAVPPTSPHFTYWRYPVETLLADPGWRSPGDRSQGQAPAPRH